MKTLGPRLRAAAFAHWLRRAWLCGLALGAGAAAAASACPPPSQPLTPAQAAAPARDRGMLWRIVRDGRTSWLYGTLHVGKPAWRRLGPQLNSALRASDVLALEIDPADPTLIEALSDTGKPPELSPELTRRLAQAYERACVSPDSMAALHPVLQATTLTVLEARWLGMDPLYAMEQLLSAQARQLGRRVISLETAAQQKAVLVPDDPVQARAVIEQSLTQLEDRSGRRVLARLSEAWERGDVATLESYERWCECVDSEADRAFMRQLNDERNGPLADGIEAQHRRGRRVFAAVGSLHMTGPQGLPRLLAERGFRVERVVFAP
jgi:uncharacterized protein YbaP (TraB family)